MRTGVLLVCIALAIACGRDEPDPPAATEAVSVAPADPKGRLDPARYRARIEIAESLLYAPEGLSDDGWKALSTAFLELHNEIVFAEASPNARETSARLFFLSARADSMMGERSTDVDLANLRDLWLSLCQERFVPARWMRAGGVGR